MTHFPKIQHEQEPELSERSEKDPEVLLSGLLIQVSSLFVVYAYVMYKMYVYVCTAAVSVK